MSTHRVHAFQKRAKELGYDLSIDKCNQLISYLKKLHSELLENEHFDLDLIIKQVSTRIPVKEKWLDKICEDISQRSANLSVIPTGITELDLDLKGGMPRGELISLLAPQTVEKTIFCNSIGSKAIKSGFKVLHIPLSGSKNETVLRYIDCLTEISYSSIIHNDLTIEDQSKIKETVASFKDNLLINTGLIDTPITADLLVQRIQEIYNTFKFDLLIIDDSHVLSDSRVDSLKSYHKLLSIAKETNSVLFAPILVKNDQSEALTSEDIKMARDIASLSSVILTMSDGNDGSIKIYLEKQRNGIKGRAYNLRTDFAKCNFIVDTNGGSNV